MRLRLLVDHTGEDTFLETDRPAAELLRDAVKVMRQTNRRQSLYRLCLHVGGDVLTLHWHANDEKFAREVGFAAATIERCTGAILEGRVTA